MASYSGDLSEEEQAARAREGNVSAGQVWQSIDVPRSVTARNHAKFGAFSHSFIRIRFLTLSMLSVIKYY